MVTQEWNVVQDTNNHVASVDHVNMYSWCKFGECITPRYCKMDWTISYLPDGPTHTGMDGQTYHYWSPAFCGALISALRDPLRKVAHFTQMHDIWPFGPFV